MTFKATLLAAGLLAGAAGLAQAQTASGTGTVAAGRSVAGGASATALGSGAAQTGPNGSSGTIAGGGSAAAGGTSATALGSGATQTGPGGTSSSIGSAGSAATTDGRTSSRTKIQGNGNALMSRSKAMAYDGGTFSKVQEKTKVKAGEELSSRTKAMSHMPGGPPAKSAIRTNVDLGR